MTPLLSASKLFVLVYMYVQIRLIEPKASISYVIDKETQYGQKYFVIALLHACNWSLHICMKI